MQRPLETIYGFGRLTFGAGLIAAPGELGSLLLDKRARKPAARIFARSYGTRDTALGIGMLTAVATGSDTRPWLIGGIISDLLDVAVQAGEWDDLAPAKRLPGISSAASAAVVGIALLVRSGRGESAS
jgi:hypothetical protein